MTTKRTSKKLLGKKIERVQRLSVKPGDVVVLTCAEMITVETAERLKTHMEQFFPKESGVKCMVLGDGLKINIVIGKAA